MKQRMRHPAKPLTTLFMSATVLIASLTAIPAWAVDPFRSGPGARPIKDETSAVFEAVFQRGNYAEAKQILPRALQADSREPLVYTMAATMAFLDDDLVAMNRYALQTEQLGRQLMTTDPLRGNLYQAVGKSMQGGFDISKAGSGPIMGAPNALLKLQEALTLLDQAEKINPNDPELNLLRGYMEWGLSNIMGLFNPDQARQRLENLAAPPYMSQRGVALVMRDKKQFDAAIAAVDKALQAAPTNPELLYLKAQILRGAQQHAASLELVNQALEKQNQLPTIIVQEMTRFRERAQKSLQTKVP